MANYLEDFIEQEIFLSNLQEYPIEIQENILQKIDPDNFEDMIYISDFYLSKGQFRNEFLNKISQITNWKVYLDQEPPLDFLMIFFRDIKMNLVDIDLMIYYLTHFKIPLPIFKNYFQKIYDIVLNQSQDNREKLRKQSTIFNGIFTLQNKYELIEIFDFLIRNIEKNGKDNAYMDAMVILIGFLKMRQIDLPQNRLEKLYKLIQE
jgi:hypothetical protein